MRKFFITLVLLLGISMPVFVPALASADSSSGSNPAVDSVCSAINCDENQGPSVGSVMRLALNVLSFIIGFVAVVMIIINAFRFITSNGEAAKIASARNGIFYAIIGLVIAAIAQVLIHFVLFQVDGAGNSTTTSTPAPKAKAKK